ncbi:MAG: RNA methyltransferase [Casimicrobiaceae bacterium]
MPPIVESIAALTRVRIVLVDTSHPGNVGASARAMLTMGLGRLLLVRPRAFPHPDASARASGATGVLDAAEVVTSLDAALAGAVFVLGFTARPREFAGRVLAARDGCVEAVRHAAAGDVAIVFGGEMSGLSNVDLARCTAVATIPANPAYASLNLAAAVQLAAYELRMASNGADVWQAPRFAPATADEIEALYVHATRTLVALAFLRPEMPRRLMPRLRRMFARRALEKEEVNILRGILARVDAVLGGTPRT